MASATCLWLWCLLAAVGASGISTIRDDSTNRWVTPPVDGANHDYTGNPQYRVGERVQLEWRTNATGPVDVVMFQDKGENKGAMIVAGTSLTTYTWTVSYGGLNKSLGNAFWLELQGLPVRVASHYFFIDDAVTTSTTTASSASATPSFTGTTTSPLASMTHSAAASATPDTSSSSMDRGTIVGIAVGATLGGLLVVALAAWWLVRKRKRPVPEGAEKSALGTTSPMGADGVSYGYSPIGEGYYEHGHKGPQYDAAEMSSIVPPVEISSTRPPAELPSYRPPAELDGMPEGYGSDSFRR